MEPMLLKLMNDLSKSVSSSCGAVKATEQGSAIYIKDADCKLIQSVALYGDSRQKAAPSIAEPVQIVSTADTGAVELLVCGKNLFDCTKLRTVRRQYCKSLAASVLIYEGKTFTYPYTAATESEGIGMIIRCEAGKAYTFSIVNPNDYVELDIAEYDSKNDCSNDAYCIGYGKSVNGKSLTYTAKQDGVLVCGVTSVYSDGKTNVHTCAKTELIQMETGTEATDYEEFNGKYVSITLENPIYAIDASIRDRIVRHSGDWKVARYTQKVEVSKDTPYTVNEASYYGNDGYRITVTVSENVGKYRKKILSDCFQTKLTDSGSVDTGHSAGNCFQYGTQIMFYPDMPLEEFEEWLKDGNKICFIIQRTQIVYENLSDSVQEALNTLTTYSGINNICADSAYMDIEYIVDTKIYIDNKFDELAKAIVATAE